MLNPRKKDSSKPKLSTNKSIAVLFLSVFIDLLGFGIIIPVLPYWNEGLGGNNITYGVILSVYSFMQFICAPIWGRISDRIGRRPIILTGIGGSVISFFMLSFTQSLPMLIAARALQGVFTSATLPTAQAFISDTTTGEDRAKGFGLIGAAFGLGLAVGPGIGGLLYTLTGLYSSLAYFASGASLLNLIIALLILPETLRSKLGDESDAEESAYSRKDSLVYIFKNREVLSIIITYSILILAFTIFTSDLILYGKARFGLVEDEASLVLLIVGIVSIVTQGGILRLLTKRVSNSALMIIGFTVITLGFIAFSQIPNLGWMLVVSPVIVFGSSISNPTNQAILSQKIPDNMQGGILGINQSMAALMRVVAPLIGTALLGVNLSLPFLISAILLASGTIFFAIMVGRKNIKKIEHHSVPLIMESD